MRRSILDQIAVVVIGDAAAGQFVLLIDRRGLVAQGVERIGVGVVGSDGVEVAGGDGIQTRTIVSAGCQGSPPETLQPVQRIVCRGIIARTAAVGMIQLGKTAGDKIVLVQHVAVLVIPVLEAIGCGTTGGIDPVLVNHSTIAIEAGVQVAAVSIGAGVARLLEVGERIRIAVILLNDCIEAEIGIIDQMHSGAARTVVIRQITYPADGAVQAGVVSIVQDSAVGIGH